jgi:hypothetical protein
MTDEWILSNAEMILRRENGTIRIETVTMSTTNPKWIAV